MKNCRSTRRVAIIATVLTIVVGTLWPAPASAQVTSDEWKGSVALYGWLPTVSGTVIAKGNTTDFSLNLNQLLDNLKMAGSGVVELEKGRWGVFSDLIYGDIGAAQATTRDHTIDGVPLPAAITLNTGVDFKAFVGTFAGAYRVHATPRSSVDVFGGARMLWLDATLSYEFSQDVGPFVGPNRKGQREAQGTTWDGVGGVKGRTTLGQKGKWFIPYYGDLGTGHSKVTVQGLAGLGYAFSHAELVTTWRYLHFEGRSSDTVQGLSINGPLIGFSFNW